MKFSLGTKFSAEPDVASFGVLDSLKGVNAEPDAVVSFLGSRKEPCSNGFMNAHLRNTVYTSCYVKLNK